MRAYFKLVQMYFNQKYDKTENIKYGFYSILNFPVLYFKRKNFRDTKNRP